jgi:hypothetical protein
MNDPNDRAAPAEDPLHLVGDPRPQADQADRLVALAGPRPPVGLGGVLHSVPTRVDARRHPADGVPHPGDPSWCAWAHLP